MTTKNCISHILAIASQFAVLRQRHADFNWSFVHHVIDFFIFSVYFFVQFHNKRYIFTGKINTFDII